MKNRNLKELYKLVLERYENTTFYFICNLIEFLRNADEINEDEFRVLTQNFRLQRPSTTNHLDFYNHYTFDKTNKLSAWWRYDLSVDVREKEIIIAQKIKFLYRLIDINS